MMEEKRKRQKKKENGTICWRVGSVRLWADIHQRLEALTASKQRWKWNSTLHIYLTNEINRVLRITHWFAPTTYIFRLPSKESVFLFELPSEQTWSQKLQQEFALSPTYSPRSPYKPVFPRMLSCFRCSIAFYMTLHQNPVHPVEGVVTRQQRAGHCVIFKISLQCSVHR